MLETVYPREMKLKRRNLFALFILAGFTAGIYLPIWFLINREALNDLQSEEKLGQGIFIFTLIIFFVSILITIFSNNWWLPELFHYVDIIALLLIVDQCSKVRRILNHHFNEFLGKDITLSIMFTFFLNIFYLQYKINKLLEDMSNTKEKVELA